MSNTTSVRAFFPTTAAFLTGMLKGYRGNEDFNCHCENTVLLAAEFGTDEDVMIAQALLDMRDKLQGLPENPHMRAAAAEVQSRCWKAFVAELEAEGIPLR